MPYRLFRETLTILKHTALVNTDLGLIQYLYLHLYDNKSNSRSRANTHTHTHTHTCMRARAHTHTHTHINHLMNYNANTHTQNYHMNNPRLSHTHSAPLTTVTPSFSSDSPKTMMYSISLTWTSSKTASTATGSTAEMRALNMKQWRMDTRRAIQPR